MTTPDLPTAVPPTAVPPTAVPPTAVPPTVRADPPLVADEVSLLRGFLDFHRDTLRLKTDGLDAVALAARLPPSALTLGGLLSHLAYVEQYWFCHVLLGREMTEPWASADWAADGDWEMTRATGRDLPELRALFDAAVAGSDRVLDEVLADGGGGLSRLAVTTSGGRQVDLRWILVHMIEEYARHNGHADLLREAVDGTTGE